jgi:hypothetical protein
MTTVALVTWELAAQRWTCGINTLNDDDALELFKQTLPGASSFLQVEVSTDSMRQWCEDCAKDLGFEVQTDKAEVADLTATIDKEAANAQALGTKIDELAADIATDEADLKAATAIRDKEAASFAAEEKELTTVIDTLQRAVAKFLRTCRCRNPRSRSSQAPSPPMRRT